jgi:hypothetical protein
MTEPRLIEILKPLAPAIEGSTTTDGDAAVITGKHCGRAVQVKLAFRTAKHRKCHHPGSQFSIEMQSLIGSSDWTLLRNMVADLDGQSWCIMADNMEVELWLSRLYWTNLSQTVGHNATISYPSASRVLVYQEHITTEWTPEPIIFRQQLALLVRLADANEQANPE